jgi:hypothetical protein
VVRIQATTGERQIVQTLPSINEYRNIFALQVALDGTKLVLVGENGLVGVSTIQSDRNGRLSLGRPVRLHGHREDVICVQISLPFNVFVTGAKDNTAIVWDLGRLSLLRKLEGHEARVTSVAVSDGLGEIATVCHTFRGDGGDRGIPPLVESSILRLWTINGRVISRIVLPGEVVHCVAIVASPACSSRDVVLGGLGSGAIRVWSILDLSELMVIRDAHVSSPVLSLHFTSDAQYLLSGHEGACRWSYCCRSHIIRRLAGCLVEATSQWRHRGQGGGAGWGGGRRARRGGASEKCVVLMVARVCVWFVVARQA